MARIRTIKPEFWTDSKTGSLSGTATKLFIGMLNFADDYGVLEYDVAALKAKIFPYEPGTPLKILGKSLSELLAKGLVIIFKWDEQAFYWIRNFEKHQKVDKPGKPLIDGFTSAKLLESLNNQKTDLGFDEHSANIREHSPCSVVEGKGKEGKGIKTDTGAIDRAVDFVLPDWVHLDAWQGFLEMREAKKKKPTSRALQLIVDKLAQWRERGHDPTEILNKATVNGWTDVYEPKTEQGAPNGTTERNQGHNHTARTQAGGIRGDTSRFAGTEEKFDGD